MNRVLAISSFSVFSIVYAITGMAGSIVGQAVPELAKTTVSQGLVALALVIVLFLICVGLLRKFNIGSISDTRRMQIVAGVSLGMREKVVLLQVGAKQLVLAVTPGRIETLAVLEGDECLGSPVNPEEKATDRLFVQQLRQALKSRVDG